MFQSRRNFLWFAAAAGSVLGAGAGSLASQAQSSAPQQNPITGGNDKDSDMVPGKPATKAILEANEKDIKKDIQKLFDLATQLKEEVDKTDSSKVLSMNMVKKAEEIEKLARDIKTRARG